MQKKFKSVKKLQEAIDKYFDDCDEKGRPYTVSGLAYELDTTRRTLLDYEEKDGFSHVIKKAKARIETFNEEQLYNKNVPTVGVIFNLKNNYDWKDKQEIEGISSEIDITIE